MLVAIAIAAHVIAAAVWAGGMFFAYVVLRPTLVAQEPATRLTIWAGVFKRFFPWVWLIILTLLLTGYGLMFLVFGGFAGSPPHIHLMQLIGLLMMAAFGFLYHVPYGKFRRAVAANEWPLAANALQGIRAIILMNLVLAFIVIAVATGGRYW